MNSYAELVRSRATQIAEIRRTGNQDLAANLLGDLFKIAEGLETSASPSAIAALLSDGMGIPAAPAPQRLADRYCGYRVTFRGQAWVGDYAMDCDDARFTYYATAEEVRDAHDGFGVFDNLQEAERAPDAVRQWAGPFEVVVTQRHYRIAGCAALDSYADDLTGLREVLAALEPTQAALARAVLPKDHPEMGDSTLTGLVGSLYVEPRRWDIFAQDSYVDPQMLADAA